MIKYFPGEKMGKRKETIIDRSIKFTNDEENST